MFKLVSPLYVPSTKKGQKWYLNLNNYRNTHYFSLNTYKKRYKEVMKSQINSLAKINYPVKLTYVVFPKTQRLFDIPNVCTIVDKFFCDALVELNVLSDDNYECYPAFTGKFGGVDKLNPRCEIYIEPYTPTITTVNNENITMKVTISYEEAITAVLAHFNLPESTEVDITIPPVAATVPVKQVLVKPVEVETIEEEFLDEDEEVAEIEEIEKPKKRRKRRTKEELAQAKQLMEETQANETISGMDTSTTNTKAGEGNQVTNVSNLRVGKQEACEESVTATKVISQGTASAELVKAQTASLSKIEQEILSDEDEEQYYFGIGIDESEEFPIEDEEDIDAMFVDEVAVVEEAPVAQPTKSLFTKPAQTAKEEVPVQRASLFATPAKEEAPAVEEAPVQPVRKSLFAKSEVVAPVGETTAPQKSLFSKPASTQEVVEEVKPVRKSLFSRD